MAVAILVGVLAAVVVGLLVNRYVRPFATSEIQGIKLESMVGPMVSMAVILLAFVLVASSSSFTRARQSAGDEARTTDFLFELGAYIPAEEGRALQAAVACYARAIAVLEWPLGQGRTAPEVSAWTAQMRGVYTALAPRDDLLVYPVVLETDKERGDARSRRLTESRPALPTEITLLMIVVTSLGVLALASLTLAQIGRNMQIFAVVGLAVVLVVVQLAILDLDRPFRGLISVPRTDIERVATDLGEDFDEEHPGASLPCDERGVTRG